MSENETLTMLNEYLQQRFRSKIVGRRVFPIKKEGGEHMLPVISKSFTVNDLKGIAPWMMDDTIDAVADTEDRLAFSGETTGWPAMGIQGLTTKEGRAIMCSHGRWPENVFNDVIAGRRILHNVFGAEITPVLILREPFFSALDCIAWNPPEEHDEIEPKTYRNLLLNQGLISEIYLSNNIFAPDGGTDSGILYQPTKENALIVNMEPTLRVFEGVDEHVVSIREVITIEIKKPSAIVEITNMIQSSR